MVKIQNHTVKVGSDAVQEQLLNKLQVGMIVQVRFQSQESGKWIVEYLDLISDADESIASVLEMGNTGDVTETLKTVCSGDGVLPKAVALSKEYQHSPEEIMGIFCENMNFEWDNTMNAGSMPPDDGNDLTGTITSTMGTVAPHYDKTPPPANEKGVCEDPNVKDQKGAELAQRWHVSYEEIVGWYCQNFNYAKINLAYRLSYKTGIPVSEIFEKLKSGMTWEQIISESYQSTTTDTNTNDSHSSSGDGDMGGSQPGDGDDGDMGGSQPVGGGGGMDDSSSGGDDGMTDLQSTPVDDGMTGMVTATPMPTRTPMPPKKIVIPDLKTDP